MNDGVTPKGRERELASLQRVLDANGPRVAFVYGVAGIGKSALLNAFASELRGSRTQVWRIDCAAIDPTESSFRAALDAAGWQPGNAGVVLRSDAVIVKRATRRFAWYHAPSIVSPAMVAA